MTKLNSRWLDITEDLPMDSNKITGVAPGTEDTDAVNKSQLDAAIGGTDELTELSFGLTSSGTIDDGAVDIAGADNAADVVEEMNNVLGELVPPAAPDLNDISRNQTGVAGKLAFGTSNAISGYTNHESLDVNGTMLNNGNNGGIITASQDLTGTINSGEAAHAYAYPADAFGNGDKGTLTLIVNDTTIHTTDLTTFGSGASMTGSSGFTLSAAASVEFAGGGTFPARKYRTGTYVVDNTDLRNGYNTVQVAHSEGGLTTNEFVWIVDADTTATSYSGDSLSGLTPTGSNMISGIEFNTGGTAAYSLTIHNLHRNTFSSSGSAIQHTTTTNCSMSSEAVDNIITDETDTHSITTKTVTLDSGRVLPSDYQSGSGNAISIETRTDRTVQSDITTGATTDYELLIDSNSDDSSALNHTFQGESRRFLSSSDFTSTSLSPNYVSATSLLTFTNELQCYNDRLVYPSYDFSDVADGPTNPDYSTATGAARYYYGYFTGATGTSSFRMSITGGGLTLVDVNTFSNASAHCTFEVKLPGTTPYNTTGTGTGWMDVMQSFATGQYSDGDGCYSASLGSDNTISTTNLGVFLGTKSTANTGDRMYFRIRIASSATGAATNYLTGVSCVWDAS